MPAVNCPPRKSDHLRFPAVEMWVLLSPALEGSRWLRAVGVYDKRHSKNMLSAQKTTPRKGRTCIKPSALPFGICTPTSYPARLRKPRRDSLTLRLPPEGTKTEVRACALTGTQPDVSQTILGSNET